jgi:hypothetical protein
MRKRIFHFKDKNIIILDRTGGKGIQDLFFSFIQHPQWGPSRCRYGIILGRSGQHLSPRFKTRTPGDIIIEPVSVFPEYNNPVLSNRIILCHQEKGAVLWMRDNNRSCIKSGGLNHVRENRCQDRKYSFYRLAYPDEVEEPRRQARNSAS